MLISEFAEVGPPTMDEMVMDLQAREAWPSKKPRDGSHTRLTG